MHHFKYAFSLWIFLTGIVHAESHSDWQFSTYLKDDAASNTLPITALGSDNWPNYYRPSQKEAKAWRSFSFEVNAEHASGWLLGGVIRSETSLTASAGAVDAAALAAQKTDPTSHKNFQLHADSQAWNGRGLQVKTPWLKFDEAQGWSTRLQMQWLQLTKLRDASINGVIDYTPSSGYVSNLNYIKNYNSTTNSFLSPSASQGTGVAGSIYFRKDLGHQDYLDIELLDVLSQLKWDLLSETASLNTTVTDTVPHGIEGIQKNFALQRRIDPTYKVRWGTTFPDSQGLLQSGRWMLELNSRNNLHQTWLGWSTHNFSYDPRYLSPEWAINFAHDPLLGGTKVAVTKYGLYLQYATDQLNKEAHIRSIQVGWRSNF
jgi:hypothetical protein